MQHAQIPLQQGQVPPVPEGRMAFLQYGLILGGIIGVIDILYTYLLDTASPAFLEPLNKFLASLPLVLANIIYTFVLSIPFYILLFVSFLLAGIFAARKSKRASSGTLAGLLVGGVYLVMDLFFATLLLNYLVVFPQIASYTSPSELALTESSILTSSVSYSIVAGLILIGFGALIGLLGGVIGRGGRTPVQYYAPYVPNPHQPQTPVYPYPNAYAPQKPVYPHPNPYAQPVQPDQLEQLPNPPISGQ
jgi:hypothetical protein